MTRFPFSRAPGRLPELSLRDYFAGQAIAAAADLCRDDGAFPSDENIATAAYGIADALLRARGHLNTGPVPAHCSACNDTGAAPVDQTEKAGLIQELDSLLYHAAKDLDYIAADIETAVDRLEGEGETARALMAADLIRLAGQAIRQASADLAGEVEK